MKKVLLSLAVLSCAMGSVLAQTPSEAEVARCKAEKQACQDRIDMALREMAAISEKLSRAESAVVRERETPVQKPVAPVAATPVAVESTVTM